ncbi:MAG: EAL domain-containing protein [Ahrensia sp.]|nr:EAL domain-containing protein [Ahrensia sp.]
MKSNLIIVLFAAVLTALIGQFALNMRDDMVTRSNLSVLQDIVRNTLGRTERSIDQSLTQIGALYEKGQIECGKQTSSVINDFMLTSSNIKEVAFVIDGQPCVTDRQNSVLVDVNTLLSDAISARNENITLKVAKFSNLIGLVLSWQLSPSEQVVVYLNTDTLVFDALPFAIRDTANLEVAMLDGTMLGFLRMDAVKQPEDILIDLPSERYPLRVKLTMSQATMDSWRSEMSILSKAIGGLGLFGIFLLVGRGLMPSETSARSVRRILKSGQIIPYFQPVYGVKAGDLIGFEVLARRTAKNGSLLPPSTFIPLIEKHGLDDMLLEVLLRETAKNMRAVIDQPHIVTMAFNATPKQLSRDGFVPWLTDLLAKVKLPCDRLILEITERDPISDLTTLQKNISALHDLGIAIAIDDVGTGHNGLSSIHQLQADYLKIDKLFVDGVVIDSHAAGLVKMLTSIGAEYGMKIIAEGVETEDQLEALRRLGVDELQGYYLAKPMSAVDAVIELAHHRAVRTKMILAEGLMPNDQQIAKSA